MGFYGNITNISKTQFTFDKRYPNRVTMDDRASTDGVFVGRYVLVEYDEDPEFITNYISVYRTADKHFYTSKDASSKTEVTIGEDGTGIQKGTIVCVPAMSGNQPSFNLDEPTMSISEYWQCVGSRKESDKEIAIFELLTSADTSNYHKNYIIDASVHGKGRGYDSTVWQKTYVGSSEKYVMVAELNTIVPTFDLQADAPTQVPLTPHFDTDSNNVYYKLHWQPQWGLRVKSSDSTIQTNKLDGTSYSEGGAVSITSPDIDGKEYPSDEKMFLTRSLYDSSDGTVKTQYYNYPDKNGKSTLETKRWYDSDKKENINKAPAAIYYNKAGFKEDTISYSEDSSYNGWGEEDNAVKGKVTDEIKVLASGQSGILYPNHDGTREKSVQPDIQEVSIMLPSIGDSIAKVWDIVYGDKETNAEYNAQMNNQEGSLRNTSTEWLSADAVNQKEGHRLVNREENGRYTYKQNQVNTLAGAINSVHDLMGMIISGGKDSSGQETIVWETDEKKLQAQIDSLNKDYIYYKDGKYYRKHKTYDFEEIDSAIATPKQVPLVDWNNNKDNLYFKDSDKTEKPGYILDQNYHPQMIYVKNLKTTEVLLGGEYKPDQYYVLEYNKNAGFDKTYFKLRLCPDIEYDSNKQYYTVKETMISYQPVYFYFANKYYYKNDNGKYVIDTGSEITAERVYYLDKKGQTEVKFYTYRTRKFYTMESENKYIVSDADSPKADAQYYTKHVPYYPGKYYYAVYTAVEKMTLAEFNTGKYFEALAFDSESGAVVDGIAATGVYNANTTYYTRDFIKDNNISHQPRRHYYIVQTQKGQDEGSLGFYVEKRSYDQVVLTEDTYKPGVYYKLVDGTEYVLDEDGFDKQDTYYKLTISLEQITQNDVIDIDSAEEVYIMDFPSYTKENNLSTGYFYKQKDPNYTNQVKTMWVELNGSNVSSLDSDTIYYKLEVETLKGIYSKNTYYYKYEVPGAEPGEGRNGSYLISSGSYNKNYTYYSNITGQEVDLTDYYYYPNKYFYKDTDGEYVLATNTEYGLDNSGNQLSLGAQDTSFYYTYTPTYVIEDSNGIYKKGAQWNSELETVPEGITLGTRTEHWELQELVGFAYQLNTIHGLMLKLHEMLEMNDTLTRDQSTLMGAINSLNDRLAKFGKFKADQPIVVDEYGRLNSAVIDSAQAFNTTNWQDSIGKGNSQTSKKNRFINCVIDGSASGPKWTLKHNITTVSDTTTVSNKNKTTTTGNIGNNDGLSDTLKLMTPIIDNMGHVVGKNTETVTLPYGFKNVEAGNRTGVVSNIDISTMGDAKTVAADSTYSTLYLTGGNKWVRVLKDPAYNKVMAIGHYVGAIDASDNENIIDLNNSLGTLSLPSIQYDEAGHITAFKEQKYSLPYTFKNLIVSNSDSVELTNIQDNSKIDITAAAMSDTLQIVADNKWIKLATDEAQSLYVGHKLSDLAAKQHIPNGEGNLTPSFGGSINVPIYTTDEAGHITKYSNETITLPKIVVEENEENLNSSVIIGVSQDETTSDMVMNKLELKDIEISALNLEDVQLEAIANKDTLGVCLAKLQKQISINSYLTLDSEINVGTDDSVEMISLSELFNKIILLEQRLDILEGK